LALFAKRANAKETRHGRQPQKEGGVAPHLPQAPDVPNAPRIAGDGPGYTPEVVKPQTSDQCWCQI
jgi:hypothetical protein